MIIIAVAVIVTVTLVFGFSSNIVLKVGDPAPFFELKDQNDKTRRLSDYAEKRLVVYFFPMADTPGWIKEACGFRDVYGEYGKNNITVLGISYDRPEALLSFKNKYELPFNFLFDHDRSVSEQYGAAGKFFPSRRTFVIAPNGNIERIYESVNVNTHAEQILEDLTK